MKFKIRDGFVVIVQKMIEINVLGEDQPRRQYQENTYYAGQIVDFEVEDAEANLHKLEPIDKDAKAYTEKRTQPVTAPVAETGMNGAMLAEIVAAAVKQAIQASAQNAQ